jgi:hypothetical protein
MSLLLAVGSGGAGVNYSLTCASGSYTLTGQPALLKVTRRLICDSGSYSLTGQATLLKVSHRLVCDAGSYSFTGQAALLKVSRALLCDAGAYNLTGNAATLTYTAGTGAVAYNLICSVGAYNLSGNDATLIYTSGQATRLKGVRSSYFVKQDTPTKKTEEQIKNELYEFILSLSDVDIVPKQDLAPLLKMVLNKSYKTELLRKHDAAMEVQKIIRKLHDQEDEELLLLL